MKLKELLRENEKQQIDCSVLKKGMMAKYYDKNDEIVYGYFEQEDNKGRYWFIREDGVEDVIECKDIVEIFNNES